LPEAHSEAPTIGSVLLAAVLLKLGTYGLLKFTFPLFYIGYTYFRGIVIIMCILGIFYISLIAIIQVDMKRIIAYSSIAHMSYVVLGLCVNNTIAVVGSIFLMLGHGFVSAALFFIVGFIYERVKTRTVRCISGLAFYMPMLSFWLFMFTLANVSFPGTCNFVGEFIILVGICDESFWITLFCVFCIIFSSVYAF